MSKQEGIEERTGIKLPVDLITNPAAGEKSREITNAMIRRLGSELFECHESRSADDITSVVAKKSKEADSDNGQKRLILLNGGDGTYNKAINTHSDLTHIIFGLIPGGTSSDFATTIGMRNTERTCNLVNDILTGRASIDDYLKAIDLIRVKYDEGKEVKAMNLFSIGIDGLVCKEVNAGRKKGGFGRINPFITEAIKALKTGSYKYIDVAYIINNDIIGGHIAHDILSFVVINGQYAGKRMNYNPGKDNAGAVIDDGMFEGIIARKMSFGDFMKLAVQMKRNNNKHVIAPKNKHGFNKHNLNYLEGIKKIELSILNADLSKEHYLNVDGEEQKVEYPRSTIQVEVMPSATNVLYIPSKLPLPQENLRMLYDKRLFPPEFEL
ncbi:hypothetical protein JW756_02385 [Candidatus Woesearchaeota archaeon]|nr:hypothetical protein [Candidatus Woesearchaeota archaeon]